MEGEKNMAMPQKHGFAFGSLILFDFDGVLADTLMPFYTALKGACKAIGYNVLNDPNEFLDLFDDNMHDGLEKLCKAKINSAKFSEELKTRLEASQTEMKLFPHVPFVLDALRWRHKVFVVTSNEGAFVEKFLGENGVYGIEVWGREKGESKSDKIKELKKEHNQRHCYYIGDTQGDMKEAIKEHVIPTFVAWGWHSVNRIRNHFKASKRADRIYIVHRPLDLLSGFNPLA
ncbi:MAG: HAD family hydrolase [Myxococcales bacterium]|nr:MAG: HAD family hydrolase [Myxococcales bacterium]